MRSAPITLLLVALAPGAWAQESAAVEEEAPVVEEEAPVVEEEAPVVEEEDPASRPPEVELEAKSPGARFSGSLHTELFLTQRTRMQSLDAGRYGLRQVNVYPLYETIRLRADDVGAEGLSIHFQGWAGLDLADVYFDQRFVADPTYFYMQYRNKGVDLKVGRLMVYTGAARGLHVDGGTLRYETPIHLGFEAVGGLVVSPRIGPDWYGGERSSDADDWGRGLSDWSREYSFGDWAAGGRVFYRLAGKASAGVSMLHVTRQEEVDRQLLGVELDVTPVEWLGAVGNAVLDLPTSRIQEANLAADFFPAESVSIGVDYRHADPTLYLSHMSIFSVFSTEEYDAVGGDLRVKLLGWLSLRAGYHHHFYSYLDSDGSGGATGEMETGHRVDGGVTARCVEKPDALVDLGYTWQTEGGLGVHQVRLGLLVPLFVEGLGANAHAYLDVFDEAWNSPYDEGEAAGSSGDASRLGILGDIGLSYRTEDLEVGGSFGAGATPYARQELRGMVKLAYQFDTGFAERREP